MKATKNFYSLWIKTLTGLSVASLLHLSIPAASYADTEEFRRLVTQSDYRARYQNRIEQELLRWQGTQADPKLFESVRMLFNLSPRNPKMRQALNQMISSTKFSKGQIQDEELYYYKLLNLEPTNAQYRQKLADILYRKHGNHSAADIKNAYRVLNDAFDTWDAGQYDQALRLFKQAALPQSPELIALYATHLRDRARIGEARQVLENFKGQRKYLGWLDGIERQIVSAQKLLLSNLPENDRIPAWLTLGQWQNAEAAIHRLPEGAMKHWYQAKLLEKQGKYHAAGKEYQDYYHQQWSNELKGFVPVVYKAQLEDINSLDLIALKFRTSTELIRKVNQQWPHDWVETYRMLVIPVAKHDFTWPATGYVSSHYGYRLHPIRATWKLHEGIDIETDPGVQAIAPQAGTVVQAGFDQACGNMIRLQHVDPSLRTVFCHGSKLLVSKGAHVDSGKAVLITGNTGASASNHLHFGVQINGVFTDPMDWL